MHVGRNKKWKLKSCWCIENELIVFPFIDKKSLGLQVVKEKIQFL